MGRVFISWNKSFYADGEETEHYGEEDVILHENGWVSIKQESETVTHYPPQRINKIVVTQESI